jgi:hypothetical protein
MLKSPPLYDVDFVLHPEEDTSHVFFRDAADHPFQASAAGSPLPPITRRRAPPRSFTPPGFTVSR